MSVAKEQWRNLTKKTEPATPKPELEQYLGKDVKEVWKPLAVDPKRINPDPLAEFEPLDEEDVVPLNENRPTFPKRARLHRMADDLLEWDLHSVFYFRTKVDLAALAFRDYDPDDKKRNMLRYMQLNILWSWEQNHDTENENFEYCFFKYRFRMGNHKLRLIACPYGPASVFNMRWTWRPTEHFHFTFHTRPATQDTETPLGYKFYFKEVPWETRTMRQHTELIVDYARPSFRLAFAHEFSQNCSSVSYLHKVHPRLVLGVEAKYPRRMRLPQAVGFVKPAPILTAIVRYFSWRNLFALVAEVSRQYGAMQLKASYIKDMSSVSQLHVFPRYERFLVGGTMWSNFYPSSLANVYKSSYMAVGYSYTNYWSLYNVRSVIDSQWNMKTEMSTGWMKNVDITLQLNVAAGTPPRDSDMAPTATQKRLGWALGFTWYT